MKTNVLMKIAVVFMAAIGAYAFSGNNANSFRVNEGEGCRDINVACSTNGSVLCKVQTNKGEFQVWSGLNCEMPIYHTINEVLPEF